MTETFNEFGQSRHEKDIKYFLLETSIYFVGNPLTKYFWPETWIYFWFTPFTKYLWSERWIYFGLTPFTKLLLSERWIYFKAYSFHKIFVIREVNILWGLLLSQDVCDQRGEYTLGLTPFTKCFWSERWIYFWAYSFHKMFVIREVNILWDLPMSQKNILIHHFNIEIRHDDKESWTQSFWQERNAHLKCYEYANVLWSWSASLLTQATVDLAPLGHSSSRHWSWSWSASLLTQATVDLDPLGHSSSRHWGHDQHLF